jgi:hypothetical protein
MAISVFCAKCSDELEEPGALLFCPPEGLEVKKLHICVKCYKIFEFLVSEG